MYCMVRLLVKGRAAYSACDNDARAGGNSTGPGEDSKRGSQARDRDTREVSYNRPAVGRCRPATVAEPIEHESTLHCPPVRAIGPPR
jgi:hypothetical protein